mmetsp:Transcript_52259/g.136077  ORF Transcript_52259/g.136077 Transcript_52259/m.136077 type:complete len:251 (-) Transcript_52259:135-887(-)
MLQSAERRRPVAQAAVRGTGIRRGPPAATALRTELHVQLRGGSRREGDPARGRVQKVRRLRAGAVRRPLGAARDACPGRVLLHGEAAGDRPASLGIAFLPGLRPSLLECRSRPRGATHYRALPVGPSAAGAPGGGQRQPRVGLPAEAPRERRGGGAGLFFPRRRRLRGPARQSPRRDGDELHPLAGGPPAGLLRDRPDHLPAGNHHRCPRDTLDHRGAWVHPRRVLEPRGAHGAVAGRLEAFRADVMPPH